MDGQRTVDDFASALISICITKKEKTKLNTGKREREKARCDGRSKTHLCQYQSMSMSNTKAMDGPGQQRQRRN